MSIRIGRIVTGKVRVVPGDSYPHVYDAETGEELSRRIRIEYQPRLTYTRPGQRVRFEAVIHDGSGRALLCGDRVATEVWRAEVVA